VIEKYAKAMFYRGMSPGRTVPELQEFASLPVSFTGTTQYVKQALLRKDFVFDPVTPTGRRVDLEGFLDLRHSVLADLVGEGLIDVKVQVADVKLNLDQERRFDRVVMKSLFQHLKMTLYESSRVEIWSYLSARVLPDLAIIRFPTGGKEDSQIQSRLAGTDRNVFRRLHHRAVLVEGDFSLLEALREDNLVAIFERPRLTQDPEFVTNLLRVIADSIIAKLPNGLREDAVRDFAKRVLRACASTRVEYFDSEDSIAILEEIAQRTVEAFGQK